MSLRQGQRVELTIEKPAAGGRMIARHEGQVVLVRGAIPGERVCAVVERAEKRLAYAVTDEVVDASADRRPDAADPLCGGALYSHIAYERQLSIKADVIRDAFARLGRYAIEESVDVAGSPERGYRMRARFHVHRGRAGFYREGTHHLCDAAATNQMLEGAVSAVTAIAGMMERVSSGGVTSIAVTENVEGSERAAHLELASGATIDAAVLDRIVGDTGLMGATAREFQSGRLMYAGDALVSDPLRAIVGGKAPGGVLRRHAQSFFQGNRYLLSTLVAAVLDVVPKDGEVLDLYAGVGLFSVALAAMGYLEVTAVEGDHASGEDLRANARPLAPGLRVHVERVEDFLARRQSAPAAAIVDPPRTGLSKGVLAALLKQRPGRVIYVSCDPPTLARDARTLLDGGYRLDALRAFDFFPTTPHVESLAVFVRVAGMGHGVRSVDRATLGSGLPIPPPAARSAKPSTSPFSA
jgi:23S rRNA (uracil1939-C5)-methyltransferase